MSHYIIILFYSHMKIQDKIRINRLPELGPLNLSKTQYRPYIGSFPNKKNKQNLLLMGPTQNIMVDMPPIEQTRQPIQFSAVQKLRNKIGKYFEQKPIKSKQQWAFYIRKSEIVANQNNSWTQVETYLLKIINELLYEYKSLTQLNAQLQRYKDQTLESESLLQYTKNFDNTKIQDRSNRTCNIVKNDCSANQYSNIIKPIKSKLIGKSHYKATSIYTNIGQEEKSMQIMNENELINHQLMKISKLEKEIELYKQKVRNIQETNTQKLTSIENKMSIELRAKFSQTMQQKMKYQSEAESKRFYNDILGQQFNELKKKYAKLQAQYAVTKSQFQIAKRDKTKMQALYQYRELWLMQNQQILQLRLEISKLKTENEGQMNKNKGLKQKLKQLSKNFNYNYNHSMENQKDRQDLNAVLKDFRDWLKFFAVPRISKGMMNNNTFFPQMKITQPKDNYATLLPKDDNTNYKLLRPNFFIYFQAYESIIIAQRKFPQRKIMPPSFFLTIRAILDAMFLHFNYTTDFKQWLSFPQFVVSFFEKFDISLETKKPFVRKSPCQSEEKINFLLNIFNIQAANTWQCEIFRSFILEQFTLDQLYFYLQCRDNLLRGSQLNNNFGSSDSIVYIKVGVAEEVIKDKLRNYDRQMLDRIKKFINSKRKVKNNRQFIDINFVLKLLLQVYSIQKIKSQRFFHHNFKTKSLSTKLSYTEYSAFMSKNFDFLTKGDIAKLYREIYTLGVSNITYKTIHYICSTKGLFIPLLRAKLGTKVQIGLESKYPKMFEDLLFLELQNSLNNMVRRVQQYGLEEIVDNNVSFHKFLQDCQKLTISRSNFSIRLLQQSVKILKTRSIIGWKNQKCLVYQQLTKDQLRQRLGHLLSIIHQSDQDVLALKKVRQNREKAMIKLTKNFKIRIQQSLAEFKVLDKKKHEVRITNTQPSNKENQQQSEKQMEAEEQQEAKMI